MTARKSLLLVIDASVMQSAGETDHPVSSACRDTLLAILEICHKVATTEKIRDEWKEHMSRFSRKWLRSMAAHKKYPQGVNPDKIVLDTTGMPDRDCAAIEKDLHLVETALSAGGVIVTRDDALRVAVAKTQKGAHVMESIRWINPVNEGHFLKSL